jgi:hypothetical protein
MATGPSRSGCTICVNSFVAVGFDHGLSAPEIAALARHANARVTLAIYAGLTDDGRQGDCEAGRGRIRQLTHHRSWPGDRTLAYVNSAPAFRRATVFLWQRGHSGSGCSAKSLVSCHPGGSLLTCIAPGCMWMRPQRHTYSATT